MLKSRPTFTIVPVCDTIIESSRSLNKSLSLHTDGATYCEWFSLPTCLGEMRSLARYMERKRGTRFLTMAEILAFSKRRSSIEHRLVSLPFKHADEMKEIDYMHDTCRLAALIYMNRVLRSFGPTIAVLKILKEHLIWLVQEAEDRFGISAMTTPPEVLSPPSESIWVLFMGGILSLNEEEETWFAERIAAGMRLLRLEMWEDVEALLFRSGWTDTLRTSACLSLWKRVVEIRNRGWQSRLPYLHIVCNVQIPSLDD